MDNSIDENELIDYRLLKIPSEFVSIDFAMDPKTDELIWGDSIQQGMVVLAAETILRGDPRRLEEDKPSPYDIKSVNQTARWCMVSDLRSDGGLVRFIGLYADGTKMVRTYSKSYGWYVKKETM